MSQDPISKNQQVYADRYGNQQSQTEGNPRPEGDYDTFDIPGGIPSFDELGGVEGMEPGSFDELSRGQAGAGMGDQDLIGGMSEEEYLAHYQNNVAPQNRQEAEALMAEVGGESEPIFNAKEVLEELKTTLNKPETIATLDEEVRDELLGKLRELTTLAGRRGVNPEEFQDKVEEFREEMQGAIEEAKGTLQEKVSAMKEQVDALEKEIEESHISSDNQSELTAQLTELRDELKKPTVNLETAQKTLEGIREAFKDATSKYLFSTAVAHIPPSNDWSKYDHAKGITEEINKAIASGDEGDWQAVLDHLDYMPGWHAELPADGGERQRAILNDIVRKVVTGIYRAAGDEEKFKELMQMIPAEVREKLIFRVSENPKEITELGSGDQFNSGDTANAIRQTLV